VSENDPFSDIPGGAHGSDKSLHHQIDENSHDLDVNRASKDGDTTDARTRWYAESQEHRQSRLFRQTILIAIGCSIASAFATAVAQAIIEWMRSITETAAIWIWWMPW